MTQHLSFVTLDVFTATQYTGNPLALITVPQDTVLSQAQKQRIAREFNLSESVFLHEPTQQDRADQSVRIDIFTTQAEIPFAGHPAVGTANYVLRLLKNNNNNNNNNHNQFNDVKALQTKAGRLGITLNPAVSGVQISLAHNLHVHAAPFADRPFGAYPVVSIVKGMTCILARLPDLASLAAQSANLLGADNTYTARNALDEGWREGPVLSYFYVDMGTETGSAGSTGGEEATIVKKRNLRTRGFFTSEDSATGSAAGALTSYLSLQEGKPGVYRYVLTQGVEMGQKSEIFVDVKVKASEVGEDDDDNQPPRVEIDQVLLSGSAVQVMQGTLEIPSLDH
ncbi:hypothetical protein A1O1_08887 [Capronia coronata CBS 617.96]|uniref:Phenazine biosynthesis protein n=1 Tax=Capronia coronata CBS 617.96 TaxID=1182541 RepID=W9XDE2_9EURO|nr:uncharacterized protein A1O1_08887 [Capronia coronata CBS 617.96]EXJ78487.1 hypothetical protein A1O1_08887 [Capronia coronata CBS 617.96]